MGNVSKYCCVKSWKTSRTRATKLTIVGCGDVGQRLAKHVPYAVDVLALGRQTLKLTRTRFISIDLDGRNDKGLDRALKFAQRVIYLAPPPSTGDDDARMKHFLARAKNVSHCIYVSTTAVYGAAKGAWVTETSPLNPTETRGVRRIAAEMRLKKSTIPHVSILRAPGIYAEERLPIERIKKGLPCLIAADDVPTNHIHADDLARLCWLGLFRGFNRRAYNAADGKPMMHGDYLSAVSATFGLQAPPRLPLEETKNALTPIALSMLSGARRISSERLLKEWRIQLLYPNIGVFLSQMPKQAV